MDRFLPDLFVITLQDQGIRFVPGHLLGEGESGKVYKARVEILNGAESLTLLFPGAQRPQVLRHGDFVVIKKFHEEKMYRLIKEFVGWSERGMAYHISNGLLVRPFFEGVDLLRHFEQLRDPQEIKRILKELETLNKEIGFTIDNVIVNPREHTTLKRLVFVGRSSYKRDLPD